MKKIEAYIQHRYLPRVVNALEAMPNFPGLTMLEILGHGRGPETAGDYMVSGQNLTFHRRNLVQVVADDSLADQIVTLIRDAAHTGNVGDGMIIVTPVESAIRIRTGEQLPPPQP